VRHTVKLPKLGDTTQSVVVLEWMVRVGEEIEQGDALFKAETDKVDTEVPSPVTGRLVERLVNDGDEVPNGAPIAIVESSPD
jgi:pyruvate/2-oxoglutarate dehydrogenase complex dihydrolipoamide acyltransferase (E2) component